MAHIYLGPIAVFFPWSKQLGSYNPSLWCKGDEKRADIKTYIYKSWHQVGLSNATTVPAIWNLSVFIKYSTGQSQALNIQESKVQLLVFAITYKWLINTDTPILRTGLPLLWSLTHTTMTFLISHVSITFRVLYNKLVSTAKYTFI